MCWRAPPWGGVVAGWLAAAAPPAALAAFAAFLIFLSSLRQAACRFCGYNLYIAGWSGGRPRWLFFLSFCGRFCGRRLWCLLWFPRLIQPFPLRRPVVGALCACARRPILFPAGFRFVRSPAARPSPPASPAFGRPASAWRCVCAAAPSLFLRRWSPGASWLPLCRRRRFPFRLRRGPGRRPGRGRRGRGLRRVRHLWRRRASRRPGRRWSRRPAVPGGRWSMVSLAAARPPGRARFGVCARPGGSPRPRFVGLAGRGRTGRPGPGPFLAVSRRGHLVRACLGGRPGRSRRCVRRAAARRLAAVAYRVWFVCWWLAGGSGPAAAFIGVCS